MTNTNVIGRRSSLLSPERIVGISLALLAVACAGSATTTPSDSDTSASTSGTAHAGTTDGADASVPDVDAQPPAPVACPITLGAGSCKSCFENKCATQCGACAGDAACGSALTCVSNCTDDTCIDACTSGLSKASRVLFDETLGNQGCAFTTCADECKPKGKIGDACSTDSDCENDFCNSAGWCGSTCTTNQDCGINTAGDLVWCVPTTGGNNQCFPGCTSSSQCSAYTFDTCRSATARNGASTYICQP